MPENAANELLDRRNALQVSRAPSSDSAWITVAPTFAHAAVSLVLTLVLEGKLLLDGIDPDGVGLQRYRLNRNAVRNAVRKHRFHDNNLKEAAKKLGQPHDVVISLVQNEVLATHQWAA